jgi:hypothetical protein
MPRIIGYRRDQGRTTARASTSSLLHEKKHVFGFWLLPRNATTRSVRPKIAARDQSEINEGEKKEQYGRLLLS